MIPGNFFYKNDNQETDIEILTANLGSGVHYTNQPNVPGQGSTTITGPLPSDATTAFHEYRLDWVHGRTDFYLDGILQKSLTANVPSVAGEWIWNNWRSVEHFASSFLLQDVRGLTRTKRIVMVILAGLLGLRLRTMS